MSLSNQKRILVAVLDWGLGHATRSIPVIRCLLDNQCQVEIAGNGLSLELLRAEFPSLRYYEIASYRVNYPAHNFFFLHLFIQSPRILLAIRKEHFEVEKLVNDHKFDAIISDNRYGCYSARIPSVFITHQLNIQLNGLLKRSKWIVDRINRYLVGRFDSCWVPDLPDSRFSGLLSFDEKINIKHIGILSRFNHVDVSPVDGSVVGLVSGPEPQRKIFETVLIRECKKLRRPCLVVRGLPDSNEQSYDENVTLISHARSEDLQRLIAQAEIVIARSGYSTLMDLQVLGKKKVILIPTPGQSEQEYLAFEMNRKKIAVTQSQDYFELESAIVQLKNYRGFEAMKVNTNLLDEAVHHLLSTI